MSIPGRLLATLVSLNTLVQPEVALTRATCFLLGLPNAANAFDDLVARNGLEPRPGGYWLTEVWAEAGGRTDLEYRWGDSPTPQVIVEAKIGHTLDAGQLNAYRSRLGDDGLLVVLVPITRRREGDAVVAELRSRYEHAADRVRVDLWTWDDVATALEAALPPGSPDVAQLRGLIDRTGALDIRPFAEAELLTSDDSRFEDLWTVLDRASFKLGERPLPAQTRGGAFERWRYVEVGVYGAHFVVGIGRRRRTEAEPWVWAHVSDDAHLARAAHEVIKSYRPDAIRDGDGLAFPLAIEPGYSGFQLTKLVRGELTDIAATIGAGLRVTVEAAPSADRSVDETVLAPLVGMPGFTADDLLDSNRDRRSDIETLVRQVLRQVYGTGRVRFYPNAPFVQRTWIQIKPTRSHLSVGIERTDEPISPQPWAWLTVQAETPDFELVVEALERAFPRRVVAIPNGRGVPLDLAKGATGVEAFHSVLGQIETAMAAARAVLGRARN
jgi:hypothetical protein